MGLCKVSTGNQSYKGFSFSDVQRISIPIFKRLKEFKEKNSFAKGYSFQTLREEIGPLLAKCRLPAIGSKTQFTQVGLEAGCHFSQKVPWGFSLMKHLGPKLQNDLPKPSGSKTQLVQISLEAGRHFSQKGP